MAVIAVLAASWLGRGLHAQPQYRIVVAAFPDLAGGPTGTVGCEGCDGRFSGQDAQLGNRLPLPALEVTVRDGNGKPLGPMVTRPQANGRQAAVWPVSAPGSFEVQVTAPPEGWARCSGEAGGVAVTAADFDTVTGVAVVEFGFWLPCAARGATSVSAATTVPVATAAVTMPRSVSDAQMGQVGSGTGPPGEVRGLVYEDVDLDRRLGPVEPGISGVTVRLEGQGRSEDRATDGAGGFSFAGLPQGSYDVMVNRPSGWRVSTTHGYTQVRVNGSLVTGIDFGLARPSGSGAQVHPTPARAGMRLPQTGFTGNSPGRLGLFLAALTGFVGMLGLALERRRARQA